MKRPPVVPLARVGFRSLLCFASLSLAAGCAAAPAEPVSPGPAAPAAVDPVVVEPVEPTAEGWLTILEASAGETRSLVANVRMTTVIDLLESEAIRWGDLKYANAEESSDSLRFKVHFVRLKADGFVEPIDQSYIYDGRWLLDLDAKDKTATRRELVAEGETENFELGDGPFLLPLNLRKDRVLQKFNVELLPAADGDPESTAGTFHLRLIPKPVAGTDAQRIDLWFDRDTLLPLRAATLEADDDQTIVDLFELVPNAGLEDDAFDTALPSGGGWETQVVPLD